MFVRTLIEFAVDMDVKAVYLEWSEGFVSDGIKLKPLKQLEKDRLVYRRQYADPSLESAIRRRRDISQFVEKKIADLNSVELALQHVEHMRLEDPTDFSTKMSLYSLWKRIKNYR